MTERTKAPVQQAWVLGLSYMQQSVLMAAVRAPDGIRKNHLVKVLLRWYRRCVLLSAFDGRALTDPLELGGGSFTGPFTDEHVHNFLAVNDFHTVRAWWDSATQSEKLREFDRMRLIYLDHVDELPHHFQLHFMHAAQIVGYKHSDPSIRRWWSQFYIMIVDDAHLFPESEKLMDQRLSDSEAGWEAREVRMAK